MTSKCSPYCFHSYYPVCSLGLESGAGGSSWADKHEGRELQVEETAHAEAEMGLMSSCSQWFRGAGVDLRYTGALMSLGRWGLWPRRALDALLRNWKFILWASGTYPRDLSTESNAKNDASKSLSWLPHGGLGVAGRDCRQHSEAEAQDWGWLWAERGTARRGVWEADENRAW